MLSQTIIDQKFIRQVNELALQSAAKDFDAFAAVLVLEGNRMAGSEDKCIVYSDPTAHAELTLISEYCKENELISLEGYTLYSNVEPCIMCSGAIHWAKISRVVFSVSQARLQQVSGGKPKPSCADLVNIGGKKIEVLGGVLEEEGLRVFQLYPFLSKKERHEKYWDNQCQ